ncbi:MAG: head GIN domain-containing protein [Agriterribacter sp.]
MKILFLAALCFTLSQNMYAQDDKVFVHDANAQPRTVSGSFTGVSVSGSIDLYLSQGNDEAVVVSASDVKYRDRIVTEVKDGILHIYYNEKGLQWSTGDRKLKAYVSCKTINKLTASGSSDVYANGVIKGETLYIGLSGSSDFKGAVDVQELSLNQSGSSDSKISGRSVKLKIGLSGASDVSGYELVTDYCEANTSGASDVQLTVNKELSVSASGSSDFYYRGSGVIKDVRSSGSSTVKRKE